MPSLENGPIRIEHKKVLLVEGQDDEEFINELLKILSITDCQIFNVKGKNEFPKKIPVLIKARGFMEPNGDSNVTHFVIIRDKDEDNAFESVKNILQKISFSTPSKAGQFSTGTPRIGIFIMPGDNVAGCTLEDLCLKTVEDQPAMKCVKEFQTCVSNLENPPKNIAKTMVQAFLAAQPEIVNSLGRGANKKYWNLNSPCLSELKCFLENLK